MQMSREADALVGHRFRRWRRPVAGARPPYANQNPVTRFGCFFFSRMQISPADCGGLSPLGLQPETREKKLGKKNE